MSDNKPQFKKLSQFQTPDGKIFDTQREASEHLRSHLVVEAFTTMLNGVDKNTIDASWFVTNKEAVTKCYDASKVERAAPSPETRAKMEAARSKMVAAYREKYGEPVKKQKQA